MQEGRVIKKAKEQKNPNREGRRKSLTSRTRFLLGISLLVFCAAFLISLLVFTIKSRWDYGIRESETVLNAMSESIQGSIQSYKDISRLIMLNGPVRKFLRVDEVDDGLKYDARIGVQDVLIASDNLDSVFIFRDDYDYVTTGRGDYIVDTDRMKDSEWQNEISVEKGGAVVFNNAHGAIYRRNGRNIISIERVINDIDTQKRVGFLLVNVSTAMLEYELMQQENSEICVLSDEGIFLAGSEDLAKLYSPEFATNQKAYQKTKYNNTAAIISGVKIGDLPLVIMCATSTKSSRIPVEITIGLLIILIAFIISMSIAAVFITKDITRPLAHLFEAMETTKKTGYLEKINVSLPDNELGDLADTYNAMIEELNRSIEKQIAQEKSVQKAEMRVLHEQIKPHFLYNSLESISYMAVEAKADNVHSALETLGSFYRNFLSKGDREIPLRTEVTIVRDYLSLQKLRYGDIINDEYDIDPASLDLKIPKLILQPLVENSIYHGIRLTGEPGTIKITSKLIDGVLHLSVYDTGVGMSKEMIDKALEISEQDNPDANNPLLASFGLRGTIERIRYYCDNNDVINIRSEEGEFTEIELTFPNIGSRRE